MTHIEKIWQRLESNAYHAYGNDLFRGPAGGLIRKRTEEYYDITEDFTGDTSTDCTDENVIEADAIRGSEELSFVWDAIDHGSRMTGRQLQPHLLEHGVYY
eukprot:Lankesteria_metandrocarpae@DN3633_c0_g1_i1.p2